MKLFGQIYSNKFEALQDVIKWQETTKQPDSELKNIWLSEVGYYDDKDKRIVVTYNSSIDDHITTNAWYELFVKKYTLKDDNDSGIEYNGTMGQQVVFDDKEYIIEAKHMERQKDWLLLDIKEEITKLTKKTEKKKPVKKKAVRKTK